MDKLRLRLLGKERDTLLPLSDEGTA